MTGENRDLHEELHYGQEKLRLSAQQEHKLLSELNEIKARFEGNSQEAESFKMKIQRLINENSTINNDLREAQENLRLSAGTIHKLKNEMQIINEENEDIKNRLRSATAQMSKIT